MSAPNPVTADGYNAQVLSELREQSKLLKRLDEKLSLLVSHLGADKKSEAQGGDRSEKAEVATDDELDGEWGNPEVRKDPPAKYWKKGTPAELLDISCVGMRFSDCPADYLEALAKYKESSAWVKEKNSPNDEQQMKYASYDRRDARRARGWALRNRKNPPNVVVPGNGAGTDGDVGHASSEHEDSDIPF